MVDELVGLVERGHDLAPETIDAVTGAREPRVAPAAMLGDSIWRHRGDQGRAADSEPEALRRLDPRAHGHVRDRTGRDRARPSSPSRSRSPRSSRATSAASSSPAPPSRPASGSGSCRATSRRRSILPAAPLRRALRHARPRSRQRLLRARDHRGRAAGLHAWPDNQRLLRDPRRGAEHEPRADEDVPDPARLRIEDGRHRRHHPDRPARDQRSGLVVVGEILSAVDDIAFIRFGGYDVVRHQLVQRIVAAYGEYAERKRPRLPAASRPEAAIEHRPRRRPAGARGGGAARSRRRASPTATSRSSSSTRTGSASSTASTAAATSRPTSSRSRSTAPAGGRAA